MITYLKYLYPRNSIESFILPEHKHSRYKWAFEVHETKGEYSRGLIRTDVQKVRIIKLFQKKIHPPPYERSGDKLVRRPITGPATFFWGKIWTGENFFGFLIFIHF